MDHGRMQGGERRSGPSLIGKSRVAIGFGYGHLTRKILTHRVHLPLVPPPSPHPDEFFWMSPDEFLPVILGEAI